MNDIQQGELEPLYAVVRAASRRMAPDLPSRRHQVFAWSAVDTFVFGGHQNDLAQVGIAFDALARGEVTDRCRLELLKIVLARFAAKNG